MDATVHLIRGSLLAAIGLSGCSTNPGSGTSSSGGTIPRAKAVGSAIPVDSGAHAPGGGPRTGPIGYVRDEKGMVYRDGPPSCSPDIDGHCAVADDRCKDDADCKQRAYGQCIGFQLLPTGGQACDCRYSCVTDDDCESDQACVCSEVTGSTSQCVKAACKTDDDCGSGRCAVSTYNDGCGLRVEVACIDSSAACQSNADCKQGTQCGYARDKDDKASWACRERNCAIGRPLVVDDEVRVAKTSPRSGWAGRTPSVGRFVKLGEAALLAAHWRQVAEMEHASVASFARFTLELLSLGAPAHLVARAQQALADEIEHARASYAVVGEYSDREEGPGPLPEAVAPMNGSLEAIVTALVRDGCVGESLGAVEAKVLARESLEDRRPMLEKIAQDELSHAVLAYRTLAWLRGQFGSIVEDVAWRAFEGARAAVLDAVACGAEEGLTNHGLMGQRQLLVLRREALEHVVRSALSEVLG